MCPFPQGHPPRTALCLNVYYPWPVLPWDQTLPSPESPPSWGHKSDLRHYRQGRQQVLGVGRGIRGERQQCSPYCPLPLPDVYQSSKPW